MKGKTQSKPSRASLVARGLAAKPRTVPTKSKSIRQKKKTVPESKPGYALYSTDSEVDQVSHVRQGLDRCANLLSNILDGEPRNGPIKSSARGKNPKSTPSVKPKKSNVVSAGRPLTENNTVPQGIQPSQSKTPLVIPTGTIGHNEVSPSSRPVDSSTTARPATAYNDRLTASTPVLDAAQRRKQQELMRREEQLQQQLLQLKQHYELLQQQRSPEHQEEQKRRLQSGMLHQLNGYDDSETEQSESKARMLSSHTNEVNTVLRSGTQLLSNSQRPTARRSLDYAVTTPSLEQFRGDSLVQLGGNEAGLPTQDLGPSAKKVKQVRIVSPTNDNGYPVLQGQTPYTTQPQGTTLSSASQVANTTSRTPMPSLPMTLSSSPMSRPRSAPPRANQNVAQPAENQIRTLQYLVGELRSLLGSAGDLEVDRLLLEIDHVSSLLPLVLDKQVAQPAESIDVDLALQPLRLDNSQLRRKLRIANQKVKDQENVLKSLDGRPGVSTEVAFEMAAFKSVNKVLQDQLKEEKEGKEKILRTNESLSKSVSELQEEKKKLLHLLSEKDQDYLTSKRGWQQETSKACVGTKHMRAELQAAELASEAVKKENRILTFTLKQKDKEIERLKELSRSSQQSMSRLLSNMQQFQPNCAVEGTGILQGKTAALGKLEQLLSIDNHTRLTSTSAAVNGNSEDFIKQRNTPGTRTKKAIRFASPEYEEDAYLSPGGRGTGDFIPRSPHLSPGRDLLDVRYGNRSYTSDDLSSVSSKEEVEFKQDLADLDANIARLQRNLREALTRN